MQLSTYLAKTRVRGHQNRSLSLVRRSEHIKRPKKATPSPVQRFNGVSRGVLDIDLAQIEEDREQINTYTSIFTEMRTPWRNDRLAHGGPSHGTLEECKVQQQQSTSGRKINECRRDLHQNKEAK